MPCNKPRYFPALISASARWACSMANASVSVMTQCKVGSYFFKRSRKKRVNSKELICLLLINSASSRTLYQAKSSRLLGKVTFGDLPKFTLSGPEGMFIPGSTGLNQSAGPRSLPGVNLRCAKYAFRESSSPGSKESISLGVISNPKILAALRTSSAVILSAKKRLVKAPSIKINPKSKKSFRVLLIRSIYLWL